MQSKFENVSFVLMMVAIVYEIIVGIITHNKVSVNIAILMMFVVINNFNIRKILNKIDPEHKNKGDNDRHK